MTLFAHVIYMQSSALGFLLAQKHFTNPLVAVPSAVSVVCMAVRLCFPSLYFLTILLLFTWLFCLVICLSKCFFVFKLLLKHRMLYLQLGGSALAVYWRNQPIPIDDKDDFKEQNYWKLFPLVVNFISSSVVSFASCNSLFHSVCKPK